MPQPAPSLPLPAARPLPAPLALGTGFAIPPRTMLLVEDSRLAAEAVRLLSRRVGFRLRRAETLASALLHLKVYRPDIVLVDIGLPDGSGLDLLAALSRSGQRPLRLVAISGDAGLERAALLAGADAFLLKPISFARHLADLTGDPVQPRETLDQADRLLGLEPASRATDRNAGADPLALRDDLRRALAMLDAGAGGATLGYVAQFLASVGRILRDDTLMRDAQEAGATGDTARLRALIAARLEAAPAF
ncbi:MAG: response regulator [Pararhodobacter sp.]